MLSRLLAHPATRGLDLDDPETTDIRRQIIRAKPFLRAIYDEWYGLIIDRIPPEPGVVLELGSGPGYLGETLPEVLTSDVLSVDGVDCVVDARELPFDDDALRAIVMTNVLHHVPEVERFLAEAQRSLCPGGRVVAIEPWNTGWSRFVHRRLHTEPFEPHADDWSFPATGPLSGSNAALPWILTVRDRGALERHYPQLRVVETTPFMPFRYLASGGVSMRSLQPGWLHPAWRRLERLGALEQTMAVFAIVVIERARS